MGTEIQESLGNLLGQNERRYQEFCLHRLQLCDIAVSEKISNYNLRLPSSLDDDQTRNNQTQKNRTELKTAKLLQAASPYRETLVKECFKHEVAEFPSSLTLGEKMYHSGKSDLLKRLRDIDDVKVKPQSHSAMVVDFSVVVNALSHRKSLKPKTFNDFANNYIQKLTICHMDLIG